MGLPGMLADALPDKFGNRLIDAWLAETGKRPEEFNPVDRLCYIGRRDIGAFEFQPALRRPTRAKRLEIARLVDLANRVPDERANLAGCLDGENDADAIEDILSVGRRCPGEGGSCLEPEDRRIPIRSTGCRRGLRALVAQIRRRLEQQGKGTGRSWRFWQGRVRLCRHGESGWHIDVGMPASP